MTKTWKNGDIIYAEDMNRFEDGIDELYVTITRNENLYVMDKTYNEIKTAKRVYINGSVDPNASASSSIFVACYDNSSSQGGSNLVYIIKSAPNEFMSIIAFAETNGVLSYNPSLG
jgi:hypothetical protein